MNKETAVQECDANAVDKRLNAGNPEKSGQAKK
jgi:hypothetical protein